MSKREKKRPIPEVVRADMEAIARVVSGALPATHGFALLVFDFGKKGRMSYISNGTREDMRTALRELLGRLDAEAADELS